MKKTMVILVMVLVLIASCQIDVFASNAKAEIKTSSKTVKQGESFTVSLELNDKDLINGLTTEVTYDKNLLELTKKEISEAFRNMADEDSLKFELVANKDFETGDIIKLTFKAKEDVKGNTTVKFNNVWIDSNAATNSETTIGNKEIAIEITEKKEETENKQDAGNKTGEDKKEQEDKTNEEKKTPETEKNDNKNAVVDEAKDKQQNNVDGKNNETKENSKTDADKTSKESNVITTLDVKKANNDETKASNKELPKTGEKYNFIIVILIVSAIATISYIKYKKYQNI